MDIQKTLYDPEYPKPWELWYCNRKVMQDLCDPAYLSHSVKGHAGFEIHRILQASSLGLIEGSGIFGAYRTVYVHIYIYIHTLEIDRLGFRS